MLAFSCFPSQPQFNLGSFYLSGILFHSPTLTSIFFKFFPLRLKILAKAAFPLIQRRSRSGEQTSRNRSITLLVIYIVSALFQWKYLSYLYLVLNLWECRGAKRGVEERGIAARARWGGRGIGSSLFLIAPLRSSTLHRVLLSPLQRPHPPLFAAPL